MRQISSTGRLVKDPEFHNLPATAEGLVDPTQYPWPSETTTTSHVWLDLSSLENDETVFYVKSRRMLSFQPSGNRHERRKALKLKRGKR